MRKFNFIMTLFLITLMSISCSSDKIINKDLGPDDLKKDENIAEKPKEEVKQEDPREEVKEEEPKEEVEQEEPKEEIGQDNPQEGDKLKSLIVKEVSNTTIVNKIEKKAYVTVDALNVRSLGSMKGKVITSINKGVEVYVFEEKDDWYYVEYAKNKKGWVYSRYIQFNPIKTTPTASLSNKEYSWYFIRNNKHKQPGFDKSYKALLDKYDGIAIGNKNEKDIFLTLDNGYENGYTIKILDILKRQNIKANFFVQGTYIDQNPEIVKRMAREGHIVLNHTNNHPKMTTINRKKLQNEINIVANKYKKVTGKEMSKFLRPPSGVFSERTLAETKSLGYRTVFWSMAYRDWVVDDQPGKAASYKHVTDNIHNGAVILLHSVSKSNTEALEDIIKELKRQGYKFKTLTEYP